MDYVRDVQHTARGTESDPARHFHLACEAYEAH